MELRTLTISALLAITSPSLGEVIYVDDDGPADFTNIQEAVDAASDGDEIVVMPGVYTSTAGEVVNMIGKAVWLHSSGGSEATILDGEGVRRVVYCNASEGSDTVIEGFTITGGNANGADGGGIYCSNPGPTIIDCIITGNTAGSGGGIFCNVGSIPTITGCLIESNSAGSGGGIYLGGSDAQISKCIIQNNTAIWGGGIRCWYSSPTVTTCTFSGNIGTSSGGGIDSSSASSPTIYNCTVFDNTAPSGGGIYLGSGDPTIDTCTISNNTATISGGGIYARDNTKTIVDCTISGNTAIDGGGIWCWIAGISIIDSDIRNNYSDSGGGIYISNQVELSISDSTMSENTAGLGAGIFNKLGSTVTFTGLNTTNEIWCQDIGTTLTFEAESVCTVIGGVTPSPNASITFDLDVLDTTASMQVEGILIRHGGLSITNGSNSLLSSQVGQVLPLAQAYSFDGAFDSIVLPLMPQGLGLQLVEQPFFRGLGTQLDIEVIQIGGAEFTNPFSGTLDNPPVDLIEFDADGDGRDEIAVLFGGTPGGVAVFNVLEDGAPTPIEGLTAFVGNEPVDIDAADMNGDGLDDLLIANSTDNTITILLMTEAGDGTLNFNSSTIAVTGYGQVVTCAAIIDWDGDADLDAVVGIDRSNSALNDAYQVLLDLSNVPTAGMSFDVPLYQLGDDLVADPVTAVDSDGDSGFVGGTRYGLIHHADSASSILQLLAELSGNNIVTVEAIDLDDGVGDGLVDLMVASDEAETIYLLQGDQSENDGFGDLIPLAVSEEVKDVVALDADYDGDMDLVMTAPSSTNPLILLRNDGVTGLLPNGLGGRTWSKQVINSITPVTRLASGGLSGKDEEDDWVMGGGSVAGFRGETLGIIEQTNIRLVAACPSDFNEDGIVDVNDLLLLIAAWGDCDACPEDLNADGVVDVNDLLLVIAAWGVC